MADGNQIKMISGKIVCEVHLLDNSMKTLLIEPATTVEVCVVPGSAACGAGSARSVQWLHTKVWVGCWSARRAARTSSG